MPNDRIETHLQERERKAWHDYQRIRSQGNQRLSELHLQFWRARLTDLTNYGRNTILETPNAE